MAHASGDVVGLRYRYPWGAIQGVLPMWTITDDGQTYVGFTPAGAEIMYWTVDDDTDPRTVPLQERFTRRQTTSRRVWHGDGVVRVIPRSETFQVLHFTDGGNFRGWYVNLETVKTEVDGFLDTTDFHLDLWIAPDLTPSWKDEDEAAAALAVGAMTQEELDLARSTGERVIAHLDDWPAMIGDWRGFEPPAEWGPLPLPSGWQD
jgi:hypothetical protein